MIEQCCVCDDYFDEERGEIFLCVLCKDEWVCEDDAESDEMGDRYCPECWEEMEP